MNNPPGETTNSWAGKRETVKAAGFGFAVLYNGRLYKELKGKNPTQIGARDGKDAAARANAQGFRARTLIFIDQEEGGRMLPEQIAYLQAWTDAVTAAGYRAGVYCSAVPSKEEGGDSVVTAKDIHERAGKAGSCFVGVQRHLCPFNGVCFPETSALASEKRRLLCRDLAIRAVAAARRSEGLSEELQQGRQLLPAGTSGGCRDPCGREYGYQRRPVRGEIASYLA